MNEFGFDHQLEFKQRQQELQREAAQHRLVKEALQSQVYKARVSSRIFVAIGRKLVELGDYLVENYSLHPEKGGMIAQHNNSVR